MLLDQTVTSMAATMAALQQKIQEAQQLIGQISAEHASLAETMQKAAGVAPTLADVKAMLDKIAP